MLQSSGSYLIKDIETGIWIAYLQLPRCPVCDFITCDGTMQTLDARHIEHILSVGFKDGRWDYDLIGFEKLQKVQKFIKMQGQLFSVFFVQLISINFNKKNLTFTGLV